MGLIRSGNTDLTPLSADDLLTEYLWRIVREIVKTVVENRQNLIIEGCYIPFDWQRDFDQDYLWDIRYYCLVMSERYIREHISDIKQYANVVENRIDDDYCTPELLVRENAEILKRCREGNVNYILIDEEYKIDIGL